MPFIKNYAKIAGSLNRLTGKQPSTWGNEQQEAYDHLIEALTSTPVLTLPYSSYMFIVDTDASDFAIGAELLQLQDAKNMS